MGIQDGVLGTPASASRFTSPSLAGIVSDPSDTSQRIVPASLRKDGSARKEIKVRPGYVPSEDVAKYRVGGGKIQAQLAAAQAEHRAPPQPSHSTPQAVLPRNPSDFANKDTERQYPARKPATPASSSTSPHPSSSSTTTAATAATATTATTATTAIPAKSTTITPPTKDMRSGVATSKWASAPDVPASTVSSSSSSSGGSRASTSRQGHPSLFSSKHQNLRHKTSFSNNGKPSSSGAPRSAASTAVVAVPASATTQTPPSIPSGSTLPSEAQAQHQPARIDLPDLSSLNISSEGGSAEKQDTPAHPQAQSGGEGGRGASLSTPALPPTTAADFELPQTIAGENWWDDGDDEVYEENIAAAFDGQSGQGGQRKEDGPSSSSSSMINQDDVAPRTESATSAATSGLPINGGVGSGTRNRANTSEAAPELESQPTMPHVSVTKQTVPASSEAAQSNGSRTVSAPRKQQDGPAATAATAATAAAAAAASTTVKSSQHTNNKSKPRSKHSSAAVNSEAASAARSPPKDNSLLSRISGLPSSASQQHPNVVVFPTRVGTAEDSTSTSSRPASGPQKGDEHLSSVTIDSLTFDQVRQRSRTISNEIKRLKALPTTSERLTSLDSLSHELNQYKIQSHKFTEELDRL